MHLDARVMRTTIEIPETLRKKCIHVALERNLGGFSEIIVEALESYFRISENKRKAIVSELRGSMTKKDSFMYLSELNKSRKNWKQK